MTMSKIWTSGLPATKVYLKYFKILNEKTECIQKTLKTVIHHDFRQNLSN